MNEIEREVGRTIRNLSEKYKLNEADAVNYILKNEKEHIRRGRPLKEAKEAKEKGARGRPAKELKEVKHYGGEDLISRLLAEARGKL